MLKIEKNISLIAGCILLFWGLSPIILYSILNTGVFVLIILGALLLTFSILIEKPIYTFLCRLILLIILPFAAGGAVISILMLTNSTETAPPQDSVLVVMGAGVHNGGPSSMLKARLDKALEYLEENPDTTVVVTGGTTSAGMPSEAEIMENYLIAGGVDRKKIIFEGNAQNTKENMQYTSASLSANGVWSKNIITVTNRFHQFRTKLYGNRAGLSVYPLNCSTPLLLLPSSWVREWFAILATFLR